ncbi:MAG: EVE domain-containing protein [Blastocatellia bacterium]|nr:EVE domain-containing protein [Blastocatellia bacterium]
MGLFWLCPDKFIPVDKNNQAFFKAKGIELTSEDAAGYFAFLKQISSSLGRDYPEFSQLAYEQHLSKVSNKTSVQAEKAGKPQVPKAEEPRFWWLNANPKVWNLEEAPLGWKQTYTTHTEQGNKRQKPQSFQNIKPGDRIIGYMTSPQREIVAVCELTQAVHDRDGKEVIEFQKIEQVSPPFPRQELKKHSLLAESEVLKNPQGSLIDLTEEEYRFIYSLLSQRQKTSPALAPYTITEAKTEIFLTEAELNDIVSHLDTKKNIILQGPPGVGKTFVAKRLAYLKMKEKDDSRVEMVQFHQSYSYEDFIQGFRPNGSGGFTRKDGIFHRFCHKARQDAGRDYFFIIDEINRGNLSRIFGELMMLIEHDKRGQQFALPLTYHEETDERFFIPENLHLIGTMNTADRSLALVDYALRRRFAFVDIKPKIGSLEFESHLAKEGVSPEVITWIRERVSNLNGEIAKDTRSLGEGFQIGHSYFCHYSKAKETHQPEAWFKQVIEGEILPLLKEYWMDQPKEITKWGTWLLEGK